jgi:phage baseplate assembly protein W
MAEPADFIGRGISFPLQTDARGRIAMAEGPDDIDRSLHAVLSTAPGERVMRPDFGCAIWELMFDPLNHNTVGLMAQSVRDAVSQWEPRVDLERVDVKVVPTGESVEIEVTYRIRATNDRRNLVYPFYVIPKDSRE